MIGQQKTFLLWAWMLLVAAMCPGAQSKRGGGLGKIKGMGLGGKDTTSQGRGSSKQGLKLAGAAAAGALGGAAIGYGLGSLGRPRQGYGRTSNNARDSYQEGKGLYYAEDQRVYKQSDLRLYKSSAAPASMSNVVLTLGLLFPLFVGAWLRGI